MNAQKTVLIVDADRGERELVCETLAGKGLRLVVTGNMYQAFHQIEHLKVDILIAQLKAERIDGLALLEAAVQHHPDVGVVFITEPNILETDIGIKAMLAYKYTYFLPKPVNPVHLAALLQRTLENQRLAFENRQLQSQIDEKEGLRRLTGNSPQIIKIRDMITQVAPTKATVMIHGARGTGKELVARAIHHRSLRRGSLIAFNCASLNENLAESELFGHERGAFSGAYYQRKGRFELAHGGTLFLDEISQLSLSNQARLLRVLEEREFERVGGDKTIQVDVRVVCATNHDVEAASKRREFLPDLYDRLNVVPILLPTLQERIEDVPLLVKDFLDEFCLQNGKPLITIAPEAIRTLMKYDWPGNVRELKNCIEGLVVMSTQSTLQQIDLPERILKATGVAFSNLLSVPDVWEAVDTIEDKQRLNVQVGMSLDEINREALRATLASVDNNKAKAAEILKVSRRTIQRKAKEYGLSDEQEV
ncbi:sigma-54-dependent Fis family transcriptional regulator [Candidatus Poribacteria bacterium]|nr:sigma-54-dependent Fis family transcriptional regulator [Candidatus Poribacteria bacterium]MYH81296.1 sigma-54-dependent Fis family transcriptional regulator [Candidatus Poribacteria bacterium]MYK92781.1 sigma-54-dependent Fis family transcriptional regulator [Candidatus Poribacteria bacterium]